MLTSPYEKPRILPPSEHPRLTFREKDRPRLEAALSHPENKRAYEIWQRICKKDFRNYYDDIKAGRYNITVCFMIESKAFEAYLEKDEVKARSLIDTVMKITRYSRPPFDQLMTSRFTGHVVYVISCMYDWLYPYLTQEEKLELIDYCEVILASSMEIGYPPTTQFGGHGLELQLFRDMISFAIAVYDERPDIYDYCAGRILEEAVPTVEYMYQSGFHNQGPSYGAYRHGANLWCDLIFYAMSGERIFSDRVAALTDSLYYLTRSDGENLRIGDDCNDDKMGGISIKYPFTVIWFLAGALTGNETYRRFYRENYHDEFMYPSVNNVTFYKYGSYGEGFYSPVVHLVFNRLVEPKEVAPFPKAKYYPYPSGVTVYKDAEKGTTVYMKVGEMHEDGHEHYDVGDFQIYQNGILASSSGAYYWWGNYHFYNYDIRTSSHNCLTVRDPDVPTQGHVRLWGKEFDIINDGGVRIPEYAVRPQAGPGKTYTEDMLEKWPQEFRMARVLSHTETDELVELEGDLSEAYSHTCDLVTRKMSFCPKEGERGVFTVSDHIVKKAENFITRFHIHTMSEPTIEGNKIRIEHKGGVLECTVLEPANARIEALGGGENRFTVNGIPIECEKTENREAGWGKVIIEAPDQTKEHFFKVRMEIKEAQL